MLLIFAPVIAWIFRTVVIKFLVLAALFAVLAIVIPLAISYVVPFIFTTSLNSAFSGVDSGVWWVLDFFALDFGVPLIISALVARFLIRRLPFIG